LETPPRGNASGDIFISGLRTQQSSALHTGIGQTVQAETVAARYMGCATGNSFVLMRDLSNRAEQKRQREACESDSQPRGRTPDELDQTHAAQPDGGMQSLGRCRVVCKGRPA
jgi:hypothetical protein